MADGLTDRVATGNGEIGRRSRSGPKASMIGVSTLPGIMTVATALNGTTPQAVADIIRVREFRLTLAADESL